MALSDWLSRLSSGPDLDVIELDKLDWATDVLGLEIPATLKLRVLTGFLLRDIK